MNYSSKSNKSVSVGGNVSGSFINTGVTSNAHVDITDNSGGREVDPQKRQLKQDLQQLKGLLQQLEVNNPQASAQDKQSFLTAGTQLSTRQRLVAAFVASGKAAIEEFLDNPYVNVVVAAIEGWRD